MPMLARPDGVELHWEEHPGAGSGAGGPPVVLVCACFSRPAVFADLLDLLAREHRTITYDRRGCGASTRRGPYDRATDEDDLAALLEHVGPAVVVPLGDGCNRAVTVAARRPELVRAIVTPGGTPVGRPALGSSEGLAASQSVVEALIEMLRTDYRAALWTIIDTANPQMDDDDVRERVDAMAAYTPQDATLARLVDWVEDDCEADAQATGDKLWMLQHPHNPWFPLDVVEPTRRTLPEAHIEIVDDGPLSRPDITAGVVRRLVAAARATA